METQLLEFYEDNDVKVNVEVSELIANIHVDIKHWNHSVLKKSYGVFIKLQEFCKDRGLRMVSFSPNLKFCQLFGGKSVQRFTYQDKDYEVVVWESKQ